MNTKLWGGILLTVAVIGAVIWAHNQPAVQPSLDGDAVSTFYDQTTGEQLNVAFGSNFADLVDSKLGRMRLPQTISADGGRYANADESIVLWNKGDSVFLTQNGTIIFNGSTGEPTMPPPGTHGKLPAGSTPPGDPKAVIGEWVWLRTVVRDAPVITPKKAGVFTMKIDANGHVGGATDCNGYGGDYQVGSDGVISMSQFIGTLMYCDGSQEQVFTGELLKANRYSFDSDGNLLINYDNDAGSMVFRKK